MSEIKNIKRIIQNNQDTYLLEPRFKLNTDVAVSDFGSVKDFIYWFLNEANLKYECIFVDSKEVQCPATKNRSTHDIYLLTRYYYPEIGLEEVAGILVELHEERQIGSLHCPQINRRVWYYLEDKENAEMFSYDKSRKSIETETDNLNYNHLKQVYEFNKQEVCAEIC